MSTFIQTEKLSFSYEDSKKINPALRGITVSVEKGDYVAVLGHNGSGKSTFAKLLNGILQPTEGHLFVAGEHLDDKEAEDETLYRLRQKVGMVFQNPDNQLVAGVVEEDVAFGPENLGVPYEEMHERVKEALAAVGMTEYAKHAPSRLSGGQKQRVAVAGIIAMLPECMILDESTAMLDPKGRKEVLETVERLNREKGITLIHITHYMDEAARANRVLVVHDGSLIADGKPEDVFSQVDMLHSVGLEAPQVTELLSLLKKDGYDLPVNITSVNAAADALEKLLRDRA